MGLWVRELIGWALVVVGLAQIGVVLQLAWDRSVIEAVAVMIPATVVFRSGISLVKMAVATRAAAQILGSDEP